MSLLFASPACRQIKKPNKFPSNWRRKPFLGIHNRYIPDIENCVDRHFKGKHLPRFRFLQKMFIAAGILFCGA